MLQWAASGDREAGDEDWGTRGQGDDLPLTLSPSPPTLALPPIRAIWPLMADRGGPGGRSQQGAQAGFPLGQARHHARQLTEIGRKVVFGHVGLLCYT